MSVKPGVTYCPDCRDLCKEECRDWNPEKSNCLKLIIIDEQLKRLDQAMELAGAQKAYMEEARQLVRMETATLDGIFDEILNDDSIPDNIKTRIQDHRTRQDVEDVIEAAGLQKE